MEKGNDKFMLSLSTLDSVQNEMKTRTKIILKELKKETLSKGTAADIIKVVKKNMHIRLSR